MQALLEENLILRFLFVFILSVILIKFWKKIAYRLNLVDKPDKRKVHVGAIPLVGGICVYTVIVITTLLLGRNSIELYCYLVSAGALVITGALDDCIVPKETRTRLPLQTLGTGFGITAATMKNPNWISQFMLFS